MLGLSYSQIQRLARELAGELGEAAGEEFAFDSPGFAVRFERFAEPVKRVGRDFREAPTRGRAVGTRADLNDFAADFPAGLALLIAADGIDPADAPGLDGRIPDAQSGTVHIVPSTGAGFALGNARQDPDVLNGAAFENPTEVSFAVEVLRGKISPGVVEDFEFPVADKPSVDVGGFGDFGRTARSN